MLRFILVVAILLTVFAPAVQAHTTPLKQIKLPTRVKLPRLRMVRRTLKTSTRKTALARDDPPPEGERFDAQDVSLIRKALIVVVVLFIFGFMRLLITPPDLEE